ncbi:hypothetical protein [Mycetohabitans rhizoxinica]|uniref:hypothetical protein n=1 Tax=Mycetohabitans rhizoxinica TaxID=412963 RepID=UPI0030D36262
MTQAGEGNYAPAGEQVGQQVGSTVVSTAAGIGTGKTVAAIKGKTTSVLDNTASVHWKNDAENTVAPFAFGEGGRKLDFLFNKNIDPSNKYNASRAAGNASRIGMADTPANWNKVVQLFEQAYSNPSIVDPGTVPGSNLREFYLPGITGAGAKIQFVELNGKVLTIIAK